MFTKPKTPSCLQNWDEESIKALLPHEPSLIQKKWTADYRIRIDSINSKLTNEEIDHFILGKVSIYRTGQYIPAKITFRKDDSSLFHESSDENWGTMLFNGYSAPYESKDEWLPYLDFHFFPTDKLWTEEIRPLLLSCSSNDLQDLNISLRVDYGQAIDATNLIQENCSERFTITRYWIERSVGANSDASRKNPLNKSLE